MPPIASRIVAHMFKEFHLTDRRSVDCSSLKKENKRYSRGGLKVIAEDIYSVHLDSLSRPKVYFKDVHFLYRRNAVP